ncbi:hypothetical protein AB0N62_36920 [Streptomyces sp. NPDC093982]|uniref:hypothetical protein n=1 Tax=Streptomyces sp. NPDC093982 TaxID=3155077 RepID=UPI0034260A5A
MTEGFVIVTEFALLALEIKAVRSLGAVAFTLCRAVPVIIPRLTGTVLAHPELGVYAASLLVMVAARFGLSCFPTGCSRARCLFFIPVGQPGPAVLGFGALAG